LQRKLQETTVSEYRLALLQLIAGEERQMMLLEKGLPYAGEVVDGPHVSDQPFIPWFVLYLGAGMVGGLFLGSLLVLFLATIRAVRQRRNGEAVGDALAATP
jgi:uncharacterized protein involved in exopolysaccharide biosynthesis